MFRRHISKKFIALFFATVLTISFFIPTNPSSAETTHSISNVVLDQKGGLYDISKPYFDAAISIGAVNTSQIKYLKLNNKYYSKSTLNAVLGAGYSIKDAFKYLVQSNRQESISPQAAKIENGKLVWIDSSEPVKNVSYMYSKEKTYYFKYEYRGVFGADVAELTFDPDNTSNGNGEYTGLTCFSDSSCYKEDSNGLYTYPYYLPEKTALKYPIKVGST